MPTMLTGLGTCLPEQQITNADLAERFDTSDEWITTRTGIRTRHWVGPDTATSDLAVEAGRRAMASAAVTAADVDMVVLATTTPDHPCPATAPDVAARLGLRTAAAYDVSAVCSGFIYALACAHGHLTAGTVRRVLVIGAETYSTILNPRDRTTGVIFGDGAGAVVLEVTDDDSDSGSLVGLDLGSDGSQKDLIRVPGGGSRMRSVSDDDRYFTMDGKAVFRHAVSRMGESAAALVDRVGWNRESVDHLVGHQANVRILRALAEYLELPAERAVINLDRVGNTSSASIPLALADAAAENRFDVGDRILLAAFGGGLTWAAAALTWPKITPEVTTSR